MSETQQQQQENFQTSAVVQEEVVMNSNEENEQNGVAGKQIKKARNVVPLRAITATVLNNLVS